MRIEIVIATIAISAAVVSLSGCKKEDATPTPTDTSKASEAIT